MLQIWHQVKFFPAGDKSAFCRKITVWYLQPHCECSMDMASPFFLFDVVSKRKPAISFGRTGGWVYSSSDPLRHRGCWLHDLVSSPMHPIISELIDQFQPNLRVRSCKAKCFKISPLDRGEWWKLTLFLRGRN